MAKQKQQLAHDFYEMGRWIVRSAHFRPASLSANDPSHSCTLGKRRLQMHFFVADYLPTGEALNGR